MPVIASGWHKQMQLGPMQLAGVAGRAIAFGARRRLCPGADVARPSTAALEIWQAPDAGLEANLAQCRRLAAHRHTFDRRNQRPSGADCARDRAGLQRLPYDRGRRADDRLRAASAAGRTRLPTVAAPPDRADRRPRCAFRDASKGKRLGLVRALPGKRLGARMHACAANAVPLTLPPSVRCAAGCAQRSALLVNRRREICRNTDDFRDGVVHFLEKRKPNFTGR
jgi:hypothetical protein